MIGETVGNFEIISQLGRGGMGAVYLAQQRITKTKVAIKVLQSNVQNQQHVERFFGEAIAVSQIHHSGIVKIFDVGHLDQAHDNAAYLVMEYLQGETLTSRIKQRGKLSLLDVADFGRQTASVLDATHGADITHRDLKPDNIYLVRDAELPRGERVKVLDFGIARFVRPTGPRMTSLDASSIGTPNYMSPEQWHSLAEVDWRTDAYALGCVLFEMLCGRPPFLGESLPDICSKHLEEPPPKPSSLVATPAALEALILRLLEKEPAGRPTMREVMQTLAEIGHSEGIAITTLPPGAMSPFTQPTPQPHESLAQQLAFQATVATPPQTAPAPSSAKPPPSKSRKVAFGIALVGLAGAAGAAVVIASKSRASEPPATTEAPAAAPPDAMQVAVTDAAVVADATQVVTVPPDAAVSAAITRTPPEPPRPKLVTLAALPKFRGTPLEVTKPTKLTVCFDEKGKVTSIQATPALAAADKQRVASWTFDPHKVGRATVRACGPLALAPRAPEVIANAPTGSGSAPPPPPPPSDELSSHAINQLVWRRMPQIQACARDRISGWLQLDVEVAPDGTPKVAHLNPGNGLKPFRECVEKELAKLTFDATPKGGKGTVRIHIFEQQNPSGRPY